jgi:hypothetical protein
LNLFVTASATNCLLLFAEERNCVILIGDEMFHKASFRICFIMESHPHPYLSLPRTKLTAHRRSISCSNQNTKWQLEVGTGFSVGVPNDVGRANRRVVGRPAVILWQLADPTELYRYTGFHRNY